MSVRLWMGALFLIGLDRVIKWFVASRPFFWQAGLLKIAPVYNNGIAFGLFSVWPAWVLLLVNFILILALFFMLSGSGRLNGPVSIAAMLILAGAIGNFIDRLFIGSVVDYIHIAGFPVFNFADAMISTGVVIILLEEFGVFSKGVKR